MCDHVYSASPGKCFLLSTFLAVLVLTLRCQQSCMKPQQHVGSCVLDFHPCSASRNHTVSSCKDQITTTRQPECQAVVGLLRLRLLPSQGGRAILRLATYFRRHPAAKSVFHRIMHPRAHHPASCTTAFSLSSGRLLHHGGSRSLAPLDRALDILSSASRKLAPFTKTRAAVCDDRPVLQLERERGLCVVAFCSIRARQPCQE